MLCGSDIPALLAHTRRHGLPRGRRHRRAQARRVPHRGRLRRQGRAASVKHIDWSTVQAEKAGYKHFMLKEIHEQPDVVEATLRGRIDLAAGDVHAGRDGRRRPSSRRSSGASTSSPAARATTPPWRAATGSRRSRGCPAVVELASEVRYREPIFFPDDLVVAVSQSGETVDTLFAVPRPRRPRAPRSSPSATWSTAPSRASPTARSTPTPGPEIGVASTKCFTAQLAALLLLAVYLGRRRDALAEDKARELLQALWETPSHMREVLGDADYVHVDRQEARPREGRPLPRPRPRLPDRARGRAQAEGDLATRTPRATPPAR